MKVFDVNVLLCAFRPDAADHAPVRKWLETFLRTRRVFGVPDIVLAGFVRTVTRAPFQPPNSPGEAWRFVDSIVTLPACTVLNGSAQHFTAFRSLADQAAAKGNLLTDAYIAAFAHICDGEVVSCDDDFRKFPGLSWRNPIDDQLRTNPR